MKLFKLNERFAAPTSGLLESAPGGLPLVAQSGLNTNKAVNLSGFQVSTAGAVTSDGAITSTGAITPTGGVAAAGGFSVPTVFHSGQVGLVATTGLTQKQIVTTETYFVEVFVPANTTITGVSVLNGNTTNAGVSLFVGLAIS